MNAPTPAPSDLDRIATALESIASTLQQLVKPAHAIEQAADTVRLHSPALIARVQTIINENAGKAGAAVRLMRRNTNAR